MVIVVSFEHEPVLSKISTTYCPFTKLIEKLDEIEIVGAVALNQFTFDSKEESDKANCVKNSLEQ